jgi:hypothetical protein
MDSYVDCDHVEPQSPVATPHPESSCSCEIDPLCMEE